MKRSLNKLLISSFIVLCSCTKLELIIGGSFEKRFDVIVDGSLSTANVHSVNNLINDEKSLFFIGGSTNISNESISYIRKIEDSFITTIYSDSKRGFDNIILLGEYIYFITDSQIYRIDKNRKSEPELIKLSSNEVISKDSHILSIDNDNKDNLYCVYTPETYNDPSKTFTIKKVNVSNKTIETLSVKDFDKLKDLLVQTIYLKVVINKFNNKIYITSSAQPIYKTDMLYSNKIIEVDLEKGLIDRTPEIEKLLNTEINGAIRVFTFDKLGNLYLTTTTKDDSTNFFKIDTNKKVTKLAQENAQIYNLSVDTKNQILYMSSDYKIFKLPLKEKN